MKHGPPYLTTTPRWPWKPRGAQVVAEPTAPGSSPSSATANTASATSAKAGLSTALVSHHLRILHASGLLRERRSGRWVFYSLDLERLAPPRCRRDLLTPTRLPNACVCSDCGIEQDRRRDPRPLRRLPILAAIRMTCSVLVVGMPRRRAARRQDLASGGLASGGTVDRAFGRRLPSSTPSSSAPRWPATRTSRHRSRPARPCRRS